MLKKYLENKGYQKWQSWRHINSSSLLKRSIYKRSYNNILNSRIAKFYLHKYVFGDVLNISGEKIYNNEGCN